MLNWLESMNLWATPKRWLTVAWSRKIEWDTFTCPRKAITWTTNTAINFNVVFAAYFLYIQYINIWTRALITRSTPEHVHVPEESLCLFFFQGFSHLVTSHCLVDVSLSLKKLSKKFVRFGIPLLDFEIIWHMSRKSKKNDCWRYHRPFEKY